MEDIIKTALKVLEEHCKWNVIFFECTTVSLKYQRPNAQSFSFQSVICHWSVGIIGWKIISLANSSIASEHFFFLFVITGPDSELNQMHIILLGWP